MVIRVGEYEIVAERLETPLPRCSRLSDSQDEDEVEASIEESPVERNEGDPPAAEPSGDALDADENLRIGAASRTSARPADAVLRAAVNACRLQTPIEPPAASVRSLGTKRRLF